MRRILIVAIIVIGLALIAVACDDDDDNGSDGTTTEMTTEADATEAAEPGTILDAINQGIEEVGRPLSTL